jgi:NAD(P)-dependent dehydrogenase (short-subunit alcohol dehydrogenase family)
MPRRQPRSLQGSLIAVTGGARGIGAAIARAAADAGMRVAIGDVDGEVAQATAESIGPSAHAYSLDVTDEASFTKFLDDVEAQLGALHALVNNAGIMPAGPFAEETRESTRRQVEINIFGVVNGARLALPRFTARGEGHLINISSVAGKGGYPGIATYSGTKFYVYGFSEALRHELRGTGVDITVVMPGFVNTELTAGLGSARFYKMIGPEDVAAGVVGALGRPRFDVFVPGNLSPMFKLMPWLPRSIQDAGLRFTKADKIALQPDPVKRSAYESRAAHSAPAGAPVHETPARSVVRGEE